MVRQQLHAIAFSRSTYLHLAILNRVIIQHYFIDDLLSHLFRVEMNGNFNRGKAICPIFCRSATHQLPLMFDHSDARKRPFAGRGEAPDVPVFLRHTGWVRNVEVSKLHTELIIKELWALKTYDG